MEQIFKMHLVVLVAIFIIPKIAGYELGLEKIDGHNIVWNTGTGPLCYPFEDKKQSGRHRPLSHHDRGFGVKETETLITKAAKVMCRQLGFTHLNRVYKVPTQSIGLPHTAWNASCFGYEPLLRHCVINEFESSKCSYLLAIDCDICYEKRVLNLGETEIIKSPGFPIKDLYPDDSFCRWNLEAGSRSIFLIKFSDFSIPSPDDNGICSRAALSFEGHGNSNTSIMSFCGNRDIEPFRLVAKSLVIRFTSGLFYPRFFKPGFTFNVTLLERSAPEGIPVPFKLDSGMITAIVVGAVLFIIVICLCFMVHRLRNRTKYAEHRMLMEERVAIREQTTIRRSQNWNSLPHVSTIQEETLSLHSEVTIPPKSQLLLPKTQEQDGHSSMYVELEAFRKIRKQSESNSLGTEYIATPIPTSVPVPPVNRRTNDQHLNTPKTPLYSLVQKNRNMQNTEFWCDSPPPPPVPPRSPLSLSPRPRSLPRSTLKRQRCSTLKQPNVSLSLWNVKPIYLPNDVQLLAHDKSISEPNLLVPSLQFPGGRLRRISQYFSPNCLLSKNNLGEKRQRLNSQSSYNTRDIFSAGRKRIKSLASASSNMNRYNRLGSSTTNVLEIPLQTDDPELFVEELTIKGIGWSNKQTNL